jgi:hypothetical protein
MSLQGPILVVSARNEAELIAELGGAGAFPVVEATWPDSARAVTKIAPAAVVIADPLPADALVAEKLARAVAATAGPYMPVVARIGDSGPAFPGALPIAADAPVARLIDRLGSALRVRTLHATALRRADSLKGEVDDVPVLPEGDPLDDATVLVTGRGRTYPALTTAVGERLGLVGALAIETAATYLNARDIDGIIIGEGFSPRLVDQFIATLGNDTRFRDLPVALVGDNRVSVDRSRLPNLDFVTGEAADIVVRMLPLVRLHALAARLQRQVAALETKGMLDPQTGLFTIRAFLRDLDRAVQDARERGIGMSLARFTFPPNTDRRTSMDAARLVSRLVRSVDFACRACDGSILLVFSGTALRSAHVVARRIASVLRQTMLLSETAEGKHLRIDPTVTLAALKANDTVESLLGRVSEPSPVAAA